MQLPAIKVSDLSKTFQFREYGNGIVGALTYIFRPNYKQVEAINGISFEIQPGERVAFVGPNGAGKSTTIKILSGILFPSTGNVSVLGLTPWKERNKLGYKIGTVFGQRSQLWSHLPAEDTFDLIARIYDQDLIKYKKRKTELINTFEIAHLMKKPVRQLSLGERMRCEIVASLLHDPEILFLDEPTIGLDVTAKTIIRNLIKQRSEQYGTTILLTSHDTGDMERVCERVLVINKGKLLLNQSINSLRTNFIQRKVVTLLTTEEKVTIRLPGVQSIQESPHRVVFRVDTSETPIEKVIDAAMKASMLRDITVEDPPMEEIIQEIYASANIRIV